MRTASTDDELSDVADDLRPGAVPLLVSGHFDAWWCWVAVGVGLIAGVVGFVAQLQRHPLRAGLLAVSIAACVAACAGFLIQYWRRRWVTWSGDSLCVSGRGSNTEILDTDVEWLAVTRDYRHAFGRIVAETHRLWIWTSSLERGTMAFEARAAAGEPSPLSPLVERLQGRLERQALSEIRREGALRRPDWIWENGSVTVTASGKPTTVNVTEMSAVDDDPAALRIWTASDPVPVLRLSQSGADVWLLARMLRAAVGAPGDEDVPPAAGLGRILHESRPRSAAIVATMLSGFSAAIAFFAVIAAIVLRLTPLAILGAGTGIGAIMLGSTARRLWRCVFRLHETGISQRTLTGDRSLRFQEIDQFVFDARRQYSKGRYLGTVFTMVFASDAQPRQGILHSERSPYETDDIARVRDCVSEEMAFRMAAKLASTGELVWTRELIIKDGLLACTPRRLMNWTTAAAEADIDAIRGYDVAEGWFYVWTLDRERPLFRARTAEANFYPGLLIFEKLLAQATPIATLRKREP